jgi:hypothetical protein
MDLTGQLHNLPKSVEYLLSLPVPTVSEVSVRAAKPWVVKRGSGELRNRSSRFYARKAAPGMGSRTWCTTSTAITVARCWRRSSR